MTKSKLHLTNVTTIPEDNNALVEIAGTLVIINFKLRIALEF